MTEIKELRQKEEKELRKILQGTRAELAQLSGQRMDGSLKDSSVLGKKKKEIAQTLTALKEKEILREVEGALEVKDGRVGKTELTSGGKNV